MLEDLCWFYLIISISAVRNVQETTRLLDDYIESDASFNKSKDTQPLFPVDTIAYIAEFCGEKETINSLMKTCKSNLRACQIFIDRILLCPLINVGLDRKEILKIPLINPIKMDAQKMPYHFINHTSSDKYIGTDKRSNQAFISLWLRKLETIGNPKHSQKYISIIFGDKSIHKIILADRFRIPYYYTLPSLWYRRSNTSDIEAINHLLTHKVIRKILFDDKTIWCLNKQWESKNHWLIIKDNCKLACKGCAKCSVGVLAVYALIFLVNLIFK